MVEALGLSQRQLRILKEKFDDIDVDGSGAQLRATRTRACTGPAGNIDHEEFFETMGEVRSKLTDELFRIMDLDGNARIDFDEQRASARGRRGQSPAQVCGRVTHVLHVHEG